MADRLARFGREETHVRHVEPDDEAEPVGSNTIDVHMGRLRGTLAGSQASIETVRGVGYRIVAA